MVHGKTILSDVSSIIYTGSNRETDWREQRGIKTGKIFTWYIKCHTTGQ